MGNHRLRRWNVLVVLLKWVTQEKKRLICLIDWLAENSNSNHYFRLCELHLELFSAIQCMRGIFMFYYIYIFKSGLERQNRNTFGSRETKPGWSVCSGCCSTLEAKWIEKQLKIKNTLLIVCLSWCEQKKGIRGFRAADCTSVPVRQKETHGNQRRLSHFAKQSVCVSACGGEQEEKRTTERTETGNCNYLLFFLYNTVTAAIVESRGKPFVWRRRRRRRSKDDAPSCLTSSVLCNIQTPDWDQDTFDSQIT